MNNFKSRWWEIAIVSLVFILVSSYSRVTQKQISYQNGHGWDGVEYYKTATAIKQGQRPVARAPYVYRLGTPVLAVLIDSDNLDNGFKTANEIGIIILIILFVYWIGLHISDWRVRALLTCFYITQWHAAVRYNYFYPVLTDTWALVWLLLGLITIASMKGNISKKYVLLLCLITFLGSLFREIVLSPL